MTKNFVDVNGKSIEIEMAVDSATPGLMTNEDKIKLDGIEAGANKYVQPASFPATMITEDTGHKFITDAERTAWNAKAANIVATQTVNGLMSYTDKIKLDGITAGANAYTHPATHPASIIVQDSSNRFMTDAERTKLNSIATGANAYTHPATHAPSIIAQDTSNRFVSDAEKATWNAKAGTAVATTSANGLMSSTDKVKLNSLTNYTHPSTHPASIIVQDSNNRFVSDGEKSAWNAKASTTPATTSASGLMSAADKSKLNGIIAGANNYSHPTTSGNKHIPAGGASGQILRWSADGTAVWGADNNTTYSAATTSVNGLMSATDKVKLDGIATGANAYTHPTTTGNKHIPAGGASGQILRWSADGTAVWGADNNTTYSVATTTANGLMSAADKVKLNGLSTNTTYTTGGSMTAGFWRKYNDGTLEMWGRVQLSYTNQLWSGSGEVSTSVPFTITLPVTAVGDIQCNINIESDNHSWASIYAYTTTTVRYTIGCVSPDKQYSAYVHWFARGKWK